MIFILHVSFLLFSSFFIWKTKSFKTIEEHLCALFLWSWANILLTSYVLSIFNALSNSFLFGSVSLGIQILAVAISKKFMAQNQDRSPVSFLLSAFAVWKNAFLLEKALYVGMIFLFLSALVLSLRNPIQIPDAWAMKLPNAYFYFKNGNLIAPRHLWTEGRGFSTPFNGSLLWSYFLRWGNPTRPLLLTNFILGLLTLFSLFYICRFIGAKLRASFWASLLFSTSLIILFQMTTDNDDLLSSLPVFVGTVFAFRWLGQPGNKIFAFFSALGIGIGVGAKNFPLLYFPGFFLLFFYLLVRHRKAFFHWVKNARVTFLVFWASFATFVLPYYVSLYLEFNRVLMTPPLVHTQVMKNPAFLKTWHNIVMYFSSILISPIIDLIQFQPYRTRMRLMEFLNNEGLSAILPYFKEGVLWAADPPYMIEKYVYDHNVWFGFLGWAIIIASICILFSKKMWGSKVFWIAVFFWSWALVMCTKLLFIQGIARYWILMFGLGVPLAAVALSRAQKTVRHFILFFVGGTNLYFGVCGLYANPIRYNLLNVWKEPEGSNVATFPLPKMEAILSEFHDVHIYHAIYGWPFYALIEKRPHNKYTVSDYLNEEKLNVLPLPLKPPIDAVRERSFIFVPTPNQTPGLFIETSEQLRHAHLFLKLPNQNNTCRSCKDMRAGLIIELNVDPHSLKNVHRIEEQDSKSLSLHFDFLQMADHWIEHRFFQSDEKAEVLKPLTSWSRNREGKFEVSDFELKYITIQLRKPGSQISTQTTSQFISDHFMSKFN